MISKSRALQSLLQEVMGSHTVLQISASQTISFLYWFLHGKQISVGLHPPANHTLSSTDAGQYLHFHCLSLHPWQTLLINHHTSLMKPMFGFKIFLVPVFKTATTPHTCTNVVCTCAFWAGWLGSPSMGPLLLSNISQLCHLAAMSLMCPLQVA